MTKRNLAKVVKLWKQGRNVWEISQIVGCSEADVIEAARSI